MTTPSDQDQERHPPRSHMTAGYVYPASQQLSPPFPDWLPSPSDFFAPSPTSSSGVRTPSYENAFDGKFNKSLDLDLQLNPSMDYTSSCMPEYARDVALPAWNSANTLVMSPQEEGTMYTALPLTYDPQPEFAVDEIDETQGLGGYYQPPAQHESLQKSTWGAAKPARRASESRPYKFISQPKRRDSSSTVDRATSSYEGHQLRSTKHGRRLSYAESNTKTDPSDGPRTSHNLVEKQYRTRLNGQFSTLLSILPPEIVGIEFNSLGRSGNGIEVDRRVSKAEVLVLAKKRIEDLESTKKSLEREKGALMADVQRLKQNWTLMGGEFMP